MNQIEKYLAIAWISAKSNLAYAGEVGSRLFFLGTILYIFMRLWEVTFHNAQTTNFAGYSLDDMIWYLAFTESIALSAPKVTPLIDEDVRTGTIVVQLVRPLSYPLYRLASNLGERSVRFAVTLFAASIIASLLVGFPHHIALGLPLALIALPLAFILDFLGFLIIGLTAFWLEDTVGITLIYSRMTMILGGMLLPSELFPPVFKTALKMLPFGYIVSGPARLFVHPDPLALVSLVASQLLWIGILAVVANAVYSKALGRIALNGG